MKQLGHVVNLLRGYDTSSGYQPRDRAAYAGLVIRPRLLA
jgi:hypothetical protein